MFRASGRCNFKSSHSGEPSALPELNETSRTAKKPDFLGPFCQFWSGRVDLTTDPSVPNRVLYQAEPRPDPDEEAERLSYCNLTAGPMLTGDSGLGIGGSGLGVVPSRWADDGEPSLTLVHWHPERIHDELAKALHNAAILRRTLVLTNSSTDAIRVIRANKGVAQRPPSDRRSEVQVVGVGPPTTLNKEQCQQESPHPRRTGWPGWWPA